MSVHRILSGILGTLAAVAGLVALTYSVMAPEDFTNPAVSLSEALLGNIVIWGINAAAFYMAYRFLKFAFRKPISN